MDTQIKNGTNCEFYFEHDQIPLHMKLAFPVGYAAEEGSKCPLVIVQHGFTGHMEEDHIRGVARALNKTGFATLRTELYGHGKSGGDFQDHTLFKWLSEMIAIIDYARSLEFVSELFLCGHSQGGLAVMLAGAMKRDVIRAIIPMSPAAMIPDDARRGVVLGHTFDPDHIPEVVTLDDGLQLKGNHARVSQMIYVEPAIDAFRKEVLIIHGDEDECVPYQTAVDAVKRYKNAKLVTIHGADHCYNNHLDQVFDAIMDYMKQFVS